jgi:2-desacetyl-2-hydroxyethyl bacteriochlorophyllide A dehydrogenase
MRGLQLTTPRQLQLLQLPPLRLLASGEARVAVKAIGICGTDYAGYLGKMPFIEYPRILGHELGVEVLAVGPEVTSVQVGDRCCVEPYLSCGVCSPCNRGRTNCCEHLQVLGVHCDGGMVEELILPAHRLLPAALELDQLALVEMLGIGCHAVNRASVKPGERVLLLGAGPIGLTVLVFALLAEARVSVWEPNPTRRDFVRRHYPQVLVCEEPPDECSADAVFDATGHPESMAQALRCAAFAARVIYVGITKDPVMLDDPLFHRRELTLLASRNAVTSELRSILSLIQSGKLSTAHWISHRCDLEELPDAMERWIQPGSGVVKAVVSV